MTYSLPFGLTQKPVNHYVENGVIKFSCREGNLYFKSIYINKHIRFTLETGLVKSKEELDSILNLKSFPPILLISKQPTIEVVN